MDDRNQEVFRKYDIRVYATYKARGAIVLETDQGLMLLKSFDGLDARVEFENDVKEHLMAQGYTNVDLYIRNVDGGLITEDALGNKYVLKNWFVGEECNLKEAGDVVDAASNLGVLHKLLHDVPLASEITGRDIQPNLFELFEKRNRELKRVRTYIKDKRQKNEFELCYINNYQRFYEQGLEALTILKDSSYQNIYEEAMNQVHICHGNYTYHNVMMLRGNQPASAYENRKDHGNYDIGIGEELTAAEITSRYRSIAATNFDKSQIGVQIVDLYQFLRKVMEKNQWDIDYGSMIIKEYDRIKPISAEELKILYVLLLYPEKFWKITNFYYNGKKSWVPQRNIQKLISIQEQYDAKSEFVRKLRESIEGV